MNRRRFLGALAAALLLRKMPFEQPSFQPGEIYPSLPECYRFKKYALGFQITQEMIDDDIYATLNPHVRRVRRKRRRR